MASSAQILTNTFNLPRGLKTRTAQGVAKSGNTGVTYQYGLPTGTPNPGGSYTIPSQSNIALSPKPTNIDYIAGTNPPNIQDTATTSTTDDVLGKVKKFYDYYGTITPATPQKILPYVEGVVSARNVKPQGYYDSMRQSMLNELKEQYMGPLGEGYQVASNEQAQGRLDSPIGAKVLQEAFARPYQEAIGDVQEKVFRQQQEDQDAWNQWTAGLLYDAAATDSTNALQAFEATERAKARIDDMVGRLLSGEITLNAQQTDEMINMLRMQMEQDKMAQEQAMTPYQIQDVSPEMWKNITTKQQLEVLTDQFNVNWEAVKAMWDIYHPGEELQDANNAGNSGPSSVW